MKTLLALLVGLFATVTMAGDVRITIRPRDDYASVGLGVGQSHKWYVVTNAPRTIINGKTVIRNVEDVRVREDCQDVRVFAGGKQFALTFASLPSDLQKQCKAAIPKPKN
jgi:hypothetical protein